LGGTTTPGRVTPLRKGHVQKFLNQIGPSSEEGGREKKKRRVSEGGERGQGGDETDSWQGGVSGKGREGSWCRKRGYFGNRKDRGG